MANRLAVAAVQAECPPGPGRRSKHAISKQSEQQRRSPLSVMTMPSWMRCGRPLARCVKIPAQSLNCNPYAARFVKTIKYECLNHFVIFGKRHLRHLIKEFVAHYRTERFHQGIGGQLIRNVGATNDNGADDKVACQSRLRGLLNFYHRKAA